MISGNEKKNFEQSQDGSNGRNLIQCPLCTVANPGRDIPDSTCRRGHAGQLGTAQFHSQGPITARHRPPRRPLATFPSIASFAISASSTGSGQDGRQESERTKDGPGYPTTTTCCNGPPDLHDFRVIYGDCTSTVNPHLAVNLSLSRLSSKQSPSLTRPADEKRSKLVLRSRLQGPPVSANALHLPHATERHRQDKMTSMDTGQGQARPGLAVAHRHVYRVTEPP